MFDTKSEAVETETNDPTDHESLTDDVIFATLDPEISAQPQSFPILNEEGTLGLQVLSTFKASMTEAHEFYGQLLEVEKQMHAASPNWSVVGKNNSVTHFKIQNGREHEVRDIVEKAYGRVMTSMGTKMDAMLGVKQRLESKIAEVFKDPEEGKMLVELRGKEVREYARSLDDLGRMDLISNLARNGDKRSIAAIVNAPAFLSGFTDEENAQNKQVAAMALATQAYQQLQQTKEVINRVNYASRQLRNRYAKSSQAESSPTVKLSKALAGMRGSQC